MTEVLFDPLRDYTPEQFAVYAAEAGMTVQEMRAYLAQLNEVSKDLDSMSKEALPDKFKQGLGFEVPASG